MTEKEAIKILGHHLKIGKEMELSNGVPGALEIALEALEQIEKLNNWLDEEIKIAESVGHAGFATKLTLLRGKKIIKLESEGEINE